MEATILFTSGSKKNVSLKNCSYSLNRVTDMNGKPTQMPRAGTIQMSVETTGESFDSFFAAWAASKSDVKDGNIVIKDGASGKQIRQIDFKKAVVTSYSESCFEGAGMQVSMTIYVKELKVGDASVVDNEPKS